MVPTFNASVLLEPNISFELKAGADSLQIFCFEIYFALII